MEHRVESAKIPDYMFALLINILFYMQIFFDLTRICSVIFDVFGI